MEYDLLDLPGSLGDLCNQNYGELVGANITLCVGVSPESDNRYTMSILATKYLEMKVHENTDLQNQCDN